MTKNWQVQICKKCNTRQSKSAKFCRICGTRFEIVLSNESFDSLNSNTLVLRMWKPLRWLFSREYCSLTLNQDHLLHDNFLSYRFKGFQIIAMVFSFGFNPIAILQGKGSCQLKSLTLVESRRIQWLGWSCQFLFIRAAGHIGIYLYPKEQKADVQSFMQAIQARTVEAKYATQPPK
jgi:hypothetical protein